MLSPRRNTLASLLLAACASGAAAASPAAHYKYCIVGAGPGGVQLGQYMLNAGDDYALFERAAGPGHFFEKFPRHRHLISLNKRNTGRDNPSFNLRHDWNSLLGNEAVSPVTNRTTARFPHADVLVDYIRDFAKAQEEAGKIFYETLIQNVARKVRTLVPLPRARAHCPPLPGARSLSHAVAFVRGSVRPPRAVLPRPGPHLARCN